MTTAYMSAADVNSAMISVYNRMGLALIISGIVAALIGSSPTAVALLFGTWLKWPVMLAPLAFVLVMGFMTSLSASALKAVFIAYAAATGLSLSVIFQVFTATSITATFFTTAAVFGAMSFYGYFTKRSLESLGQFLFIGLIGVIIASLVNLFLESNTLTMVVSAIAVIVFVGLTAYDTQRIREMIMSGGLDDRATTMGALSLYLDFINIFVNLLQLFGGRKE
jgi:uncharacterized protein